MCDIDKATKQGEGKQGIQSRCALLKIDLMSDPVCEKVW